MRCAQPSLVLELPQVCWELYDVHVPILQKARESVLCHLKLDVSKHAGRTASESTCEDLGWTFFRLSETIQVLTPEQKRMPAIAPGMPDFVFGCTACSQQRCSNKCAKRISCNLA